MGRETGLEPATTGITIPRNCVAYIQLKLEGGETGYFFNLSYTRVTQFRVNYMSILHLMCEGEYINKSPTWGFPIWEVGRETGLEPATTGITIPRNCVAYIQLKLEGGDTGYFSI